MLPPIKLDLENIEEGITKLGFIIVLVLILGICFLAGYMTNSTAKEAVCKTYIQENLELVRQNENCQSAYIDLQDRCSIECIPREREICTEEKQALKERIKALRCSICTQEGPTQ